MEATAQYFPVVLFITLYKVHGSNFLVICVINSSRHRRCFIRGYIHELFVSKALTRSYLARSGFVDCLQSAFSLKIRPVLISSSAIANHDTRQAASPLACLGLACSNFAKKNKRLLAVRGFDTNNS